MQLFPFSYHFISLPMHLLELQVCIYKKVLHRAVLYFVQKDMITGESPTLTLKGLVISVPSDRMFLFKTLKALPLLLS